MKLIRAILLTISIFIIAPSMYGQFRSVPPDNAACGTPPPPDNYREVLLPNKSYRNFISEEDSIIVPVVFHVYHTGTPVGELYNVSDETLFLAVHRLNEAFSHTGIYDTTEFSTPENPPAVDTHIRFALAKRDPDGNPTDGINRIDVSEITPLYAGNGVLNSTLLSCGGLSPCPIIDNNLFSNSVWDQDPPEVIDGNGNDGYLNIFIVNGINGAVGGTGGVQGYSKIPGSNSGESTSTGVVVRSSKLTGMMNTLAHEVGHWLGLYHTFGQTNSMPFCPSQSNCLTQLDKVCDTAPDSDGGGCSSFCPGANVRNIMSYHSCRTMFTQGQSDRMWTHGIDYAYPWLLNTINWLPFNDYDLRVSANAVQERCIDSFTDKIRVDNLGSLSVTGFTVRVTGPSGIVYDQYFDQTILSGDNFYIEFENYLNPGINEFTYEVITPVDEYLANNTHVRTVTQNIASEEIKITYQKDAYGATNGEGVLVTLTDPEGNCETCPVLLDYHPEGEAVFGCLYDTLSVCIPNNTCATVKLTWIPSQGNPWGFEYCSVQGDVYTDLPLYTISYEDQFISESVFADDYPGSFIKTHTFCNGEFDPVSVCIDEDNDLICDYEDSCVGEYDALNICNGDCEDDADGDGVCDDIDPCIGFYDECNVCNGPGAIYDCGCQIKDCDWCDCEGTVIDALGVCGGNCDVDLDEDGICDDKDTCIDFNGDYFCDTNPCGSTTEITVGNTTASVYPMGNLCWSDPIKSTTFSNNDQITQANTKQEWKDLTSAGPVMRVIDDEIGLYNWAVVDDSRKICPSGWHPSSDDDWMVLEEFLGLEKDKRVRFGHPRVAGIVEKVQDLEGLFLFPVVKDAYSNYPGAIDGLGNLRFDGDRAMYWTSTRSYTDNKYKNNSVYRSIYGNNIGRFYTYQSTINTNYAGMMIRCVKDQD